MLIKNIIQDRIRCPQCGKVVAEAVNGEARFTCPRCKLTFMVSTIDKELDKIK